MLTPKKMKDRIRQLMESQHLSQQSFADMLDISPASLSSIFNDRTRPTLNHVDAIKRSFPNINLQWLLYGEGEMFKSGVAETQNQDVQPTAQPVGLTLDFDSTPSVQPAASSAPIPSQGTIGYDSQYNFHNQKIADIKQRKITEIRIFYDDQTWETFVPKK